jgi:toxin YoeB
MAKRIIWSERAKADKRRILTYWRRRNKSNVYPKKLNRIFKESILAIGSSPFSGKRTNYTNAKVKIVRDYKVFYDETETTIEILTIWDTRQDPDKLENILK